MIWIQYVIAMYLPENLKNADYHLFAEMNGRWHSHFFDLFFPFIREPYVWLPLYIFLAIFAIINFNIKGFYWTLFLGATAGISDYTSSNIVKNIFERARPCHEPAVAGTLRFLVSYCPESSSFTSSHASNHFAIAMFIFTTFNRTVSPKWAIIFLWAFLIAYAQVYVGVHFPFDVFCGALLGAIIGYTTSKIFNTKIGLLPPMK
ncbi:MAG TPA: phosphatase PAP2 family protein [Chitinophagaceae bacterium]|nr:phosphatase PAP2 family protein [Chitinophagaceae bacterium]